MSVSLRLAFVTALASALAACGETAVPNAPPASSSSISGLALEKISEAEQPWGMAFLPSGELLFTEKEGGLHLLAAGQDAKPITGLPEAYTEGQAGYLGLAIDPGFAGNRLVYVALSTGTPEANATAVFRARLSEDLTRLEDARQIFRADERATAYHYGARLAFAPDGSLFISLGDGFRYMKDAQSPENTHGTIIRILPDGSIPQDNPFVDGSGGHPAVWSWGHRNVQGLAFDPESGALWASEHGPKGGDELNIIRPGTNYGWPEVTYGVNYDGTIISRLTEAENLASPEQVWVPSIAPSGLTFLSSDRYPGWQGDLFSGGMNGPAGMVLVRLDMEDGRIVGKEDLLKDEIPVRDVIMGPDGYLYVASKDFDGIFRLVPTLR